MTWDVDFSEVGKKFRVGEHRSIGFVIQEHMILGERAIMGSFENDRNRIRNRVFELQGITHLKVGTKESQVGDRLSSPTTIAVARSTRRTPLSCCIGFGFDDYMTVFDPVRVG